MLVQKNFNIYDQWGKKFYKCILMYMYWIEHNEANLSHSDTQITLALKMVLVALTFHVQDVTKDCGYIMLHVLQWLEEYF